VVVVLARFVPIKGVDVVIDALAHLRSQVRLVIAGDGPERAALERRIDEMRNERSFRPKLGQPDLGHEVELVGEVDMSTRDALLARASLVVVPSRVLPNGRREGMPVVALEALAAGVPVVASAVGGLTELSEIRCVMPDDPRALADAIEEALAAKPRVERLRAVVAHLEWADVANRLLA
jgi:glycosyltransferase involved in cell wall biosynthesis